MHTFTFRGKWDISTSVMFEYLSTLETFLNVAAEKFRATGRVVKHFDRAVVMSFLTFSVRVLAN